MAKTAVPLRVTKRTAKVTPLKPVPFHAAAFLEQARQAGLLDGEKTAHVSFRVPKALLDAARRESGNATLTEIGIMALAMLAQPDPVAKFMRETRGCLGPDHTLEY